jgi:hypothetical protein
MHLFDGLVPAWPTFGINLEAEVKGWPEMVILPDRYTLGYGERWDNFDQKTKSASRFGGFIAAILGTMQNWNDNSLSRMPGVRDRIARVRLRHHEGGLNLDMSASDITAIASRGEQAAVKLLARFAEKLPDGFEAEGWDEQRFVRLNVLLKMMEARRPGLATALDPACAHATDFDTLIANASRCDAPAGYEAPLTPEQAQALRGALTSLEQLLARPDGSIVNIGFKPVPKPELRVRPPL